MTGRKTPILLRRGPVSDEVYAIYDYRLIRGGQVVKAASNGKQSVSDDFYALACEELLDPDSPDIVGILDGVADGESLTDDERLQVRGFRERLKTMVERHNAHVAPEQEAASSLDDAA